MSKRRSIDRVLFDLLVLALGTAMCGYVTMLFLFALISEINKYFRGDSGDYNREGSFVFALCMFAMFAGPTLVLIERWPQQSLWAIWACRPGGPPAPRGTLIFPEGPAGTTLRIRLPHESWFSSVVFLAVLVWPMLIVAYLLDWLACPGWVQLAVPTAILLGLWYGRYRRYQHNLQIGSLDLIIDRQSGTLQVPIVDGSRPPITLPISAALGLSIERVIEADSESTSPVYYVDLRQRELPDFRITQFNDRDDAEQLVQIICGQTGLPELAPEAPADPTPAQGDDGGESRGEVGPSVDRDTVPSTTAGGRRVHDSPDGRQD